MRWVFPVVVLAVVLASCGPSASSGPGAGQVSLGQAQSTAPSAPKAIVAAINEDPKNMWDGINGGGGGGSREVGHLLNQYLANILADGTPVPRLLAELPSVENGTWRVAADGSMEVTYKLRPGVTWHDGTPFTADDVAFSWEVDRDPAIPSGNQTAVKLIKSITVLDPQTAVASWTHTYAYADRLEDREFYPLPKHLLETAYRENRENLISQPYFSDGFVGLGPFKLAAWEHGASMDLVANDNYFLGRPKLDRIRVMFISSAATGVANLRAGSVQVFLPSGGPDFGDMESLAQEWATTKRGTIYNESVRWSYVEIQKSAAADPAELRDPRMRQALMLGLNRLELAQAIYGDLGTVADSWVHPSLPYYPQVRDAITQFPYDRNRATTMLAGMGWTPGPEGVLQKGGARFQLGLRFGATSESQGTIVRDYWKSLGIDVALDPFSNTQLRDSAARASFTGADYTNNPLGGLSAVRKLATDQIPTAANRYAGTNRGSFANAEWDTLGESLRVALDDNRRVSIERDLLRVFSAELPVLPTYFELQSIAVSGFTGFNSVTGVPHTGQIMHTTNANEWDLP